MDGVLDGSVRELGLYPEGLKSVSLDAVGMVGGGSSEAVGMVGDWSSEVVGIVRCGSSEAVGMVGGVARNQLGWWEVGARRLLGWWEVGAWKLLRVRVVKLRAQNRKLGGLTWGFKWNVGSHNLISQNIQNSIHLCFRHIRPLSIVGLLSWAR